MKVPKKGRSTGKKATSPATHPEEVLEKAPDLGGSSDWPVNSEVAAAINRWAASAIVNRQLKDQLEADKRTLVELILPMYIERWIATGAPPPNPRLVARKAACQFVVQPTKLTVVLPKGVKTVDDALVATGLQAARAKVFSQYVKLAKEDEFLGSLSGMLNHEVEQIRTAAQSLYQAMKQHEQWSLLLQPQRRLVVKNPRKFADDLHTVAKSRQEAGRVLRVIQPTAYPFNALHTAAMATFQLRQAWENESQREYITPDGKYRILAQHKYVLVFVKSGKVWQHLGTSECKGVSEARQFAQKVMAEPDLVATFG